MGDWCFLKVPSEFFIDQILGGPISVSEIAFRPIGAGCRMKRPKLKIDGDKRGSKFCRYVGSAPLQTARKFW